MPAPRLPIVSSDPIPSDLAPEERRDRIVAMLAGCDRLAVADLVRLFATSEDSIRRDLRRLVAEGRIRRVHGAVLASQIVPLPREERETLHLAEKRAVARHVAAGLRDGETVLIGGGTTMCEVARAIPPDRRLTVVTSAPTVALILAEKPLVETILVGGRLDVPSGTVVGARAIETLAAVRADLAVVSACSIDSLHGVSVSRHEEAFVVRAMIDAAARVLAVATCEKLATTSAHLVAPIDRFDELVTDAGADPAEIEALRAHGLVVTIARASMPRTP